MVMARQRNRMTWYMFTLAFLMTILNVWLALKLLDLQDKSLKACTWGNVMREDARLLLKDGGYPGKAAHPALRERPCSELYGNGLRP